MVNLENGLLDIQIIAIYLVIFLSKVYLNKFDEMFLIFLNIDTFLIDSRNQLTFKESCEKINCWEFQFKFLT